MMKTWKMRGRYYLAFVPAGGLFLFNGCGLSDQQLTGILTSVITTGLSTLVNTVLAGLAVPA